MLRFFALFVVLPLLVAGCKRSQNQSRSGPNPIASASPSAVAAARPAIPATPAPTPRVVVNRNARFIVLCYHRFEDRPKDYLAIKPDEFRAQMQALKDNGVAVIPMKDMLAWKKGEKNIPAKSCVITIDDGYNSGYSVAWPILKQFGYPFTLFIYTNYVNVGGKSITWSQLEEMRDAGVDIESHTVSHHDLRHAPKGQDYASWLHNEVFTSKQILEDKLGIKIVAFAFPYGTYNEQVRKMASDAGYQAEFTVYGQHMGIDAPMDNLGRYALNSKEPKMFKDALDFGPGSENAPAESMQLAAASMITQPMNDQHISNATPTIKANLATMGEVDPKSVEMRVSGFGLVPANYDTKTKLVSYAFTQKLEPKTYTVILSAKVQGKRVETRWNFTVDPEGGATANKAASS